ncbi:MAG: hypothetical protein JNK82_32300 [Myxococcaceae bacterium]|nr:hypothetical protein [Myxococcaceae bacterium]
MSRALVFALVLCACGSTSTVVTSAGGGMAGTGGSGGSGGSGGRAGGGSSSTGGSGGYTDGCSDASKTVYVIDSDSTFSAFDPLTKTFRPIGSLSCPTSDATATPFSMSVARDAFAYVLYNNGEVFKVSTSNLACTPTAWQPNVTFRRFGMGFSTDAPGSTSETLFIAAGSMSMTTSTLGRLSLDNFMAQAGPTIVGSPELTGTGDAQLWGFFPQGAANPFVARIDKSTGAFLSNYPAPALAGVARRWAFAFWGGRFWIFFQRDSDASTNVWEMRADDGTVTEALNDTGRRIVGAGVSTCAPIMIN